MACFGGRYNGCTDWLILGHDYSLVKKCPRADFGPAKPNKKPYTVEPRINEVAAWGPAKFVREVEGSLYRKLRYNEFEVK